MHRQDSRHPAIGEMLRAFRELESPLPAKALDKQMNKKTTAQTKIRYGIEKK